MEKRVVFRSAWLPYALVAPQLAITFVFFFWPASQALWFSFQLQDAFGIQTQFVGLQNFANLFKDSNYLDSFRTTAVFSMLVAGIGIALSLLLAVMADRVVRGAFAYKTLLIWPYAVAAAVAGVLYAFMFAPSIGIVSYVIKGWGVRWNWARWISSPSRLIALNCCGASRIFSRCRIFRVRCRRATWNWSRKRIRSRP